MKWISTVILINDVQEFLRMYYFDENTLHITPINTYAVLITLHGKRKPIED